MNKNDLLDEISSLMKQVSALEKDLERKREKLKQKQRQYELLEKEPKVTDHALMRLLERRYNLNLEEVRQSILCEKVVGAIKAGASSVTVNNIKFVIDPKTKTVITCI